MRTVLATLLVLCLLTTAACEEKYESADAEAGAIAQSPAAARSHGYVSTASRDAHEAADGLEEADSEPTKAPPSDPQSNAVEGRKIIYNASLDLAVDQFDSVPAGVAALTTRYGGFIANSNISGTRGEPRHGRWTLRIPSARFDAFMSDAQASIGQVRNLTSDSREVTAEYTDLESRIRNLKAEEARLQEHMNANTRNLDEILRVEREIARVRGEAELYEGRLNVLKDLTMLSTVTLTVQEIDTFAPPATEEPGFGTQVARAWGGSVDALGSFLTGLALVVVRATPWLLIAVPALLIGWPIIRRVSRPVATQQTA